MGVKISLEECAGDMAGDMLGRDKVGVLFPLPSPSSCSDSSSSKDGCREREIPPMLSNEMDLNFDAGDGG